MASLPLPQLLNPEGMTAPLREVSPMATTPHIRSDVCLRKCSYKCSWPLAPHNVLQDPMMSALSPTIIFDVIDMVNDRFDSKRGKLCNPYQHQALSCLGRNGVAMPQFRMFNGSRNSTQRLAHYISRCGPVINGTTCTRGTIIPTLRAVIAGSGFYMVRGPPRGLHYQLAINGATVPQEIL